MIARRQRGPAPRDNVGAASLNAAGGIVSRASAATLAGLTLYCALIAVMLITAPRPALALPLTPFRYQEQAQRHCPDDEVVWLDFRAGRYYLKTQKRYGTGLTGSYVCRSEAKASGYRRSLLGLR